MPSELVTRVRAKYPEQYKDLSDVDLEAAILKQHPEYKDLATPAPTSREPLLTQMGERPTGGYTTSDTAPAPAAHPVTDALATAAHPSSLGDFLGLLIPSELPAWLGARKAATATGEAAIRAVDIAKGTWTGVGSYLAKRMPVISDIVKSVQNEAAQREITSLIARVESPENLSKGLLAVAQKQGGRLAPRDLKAVFDLKDMVDEARRVADVPIEVGGTVPGRSTARATVQGPEVVPTKSGPMVTTLPDKWGVTTIRQR